MSARGYTEKRRAATSFVAEQTHGPEDGAKGGSGDDTASRVGKRIAVISMDMQLPPEVMGSTRYRYIAGLLAKEGYDVDIITSAYQHWEKRQRDLDAFVLEDTFDPDGGGFDIVFLHEPGYAKNVDLKRIKSHRVACRNLRAYLDEHFDYDLVYCQIPPNDLARVAAEVACAHHVPFVVDVNDLWPEAMRMAFDVPVVSDILFSGFTRDAKAVYGMASAVVGTSEEYAARPFKDRAEDIPKVVVYVGNQIVRFDEGVRTHMSSIVKPEGEFWVTYAGTLGKSYDLFTLIDCAAKLASDGFPQVKVKILGGGPIEGDLKAHAAQLGLIGGTTKDEGAAKDSDATVTTADDADVAVATAGDAAVSGAAADDVHASGAVEFLGYRPYDQMAAWLTRSDVLLNSLVKGAPQSVPTKIGDYLAAGHPMISTSESPEFMAKVETDGFGSNVAPADVDALAGAIERLASDPSLCATMGAKARAIAQAQFDRPESYRRIVDLVNGLI